MMPPKLVGWGESAWISPSRLVVKIRLESAAFDGLGDPIHNIYCLEGTIVGLGLSSLYIGGWGVSLVGGGVSRADVAYKT